MKISPSGLFRLSPLASFSISVIAVLLALSPTLPAKPRVDQETAAKKEVSAEVGGPDSAKAAAAKTKHLRLCAQLGIVVNARYEFLLAPEKIYYYEVKSLGANGWILVKGFNYPDTWVNLSQVISVTRITANQQNEKAKE